jgi:hypothetical protein
MNRTDILVGLDSIEEQIKQIKCLQQKGKRFCHLRSFLWRFHSVPICGDTLLEVSLQILISIINTAITRPALMIHMKWEIGPREAKLPLSIQGTLAYCPLEEEGLLPTSTPVINPNTSSIIIEKRWV